MYTHFFFLHFNFLTAICEDHKLWVFASYPPPIIIIIITIIIITIIIITATYTADPNGRVV